jgi:hypothetical protein
MKTKKLNALFIVREIMRSWWVFAFAIITFALYEQSAGRLGRSIQKLEKQQSLLEAEIAELANEQEELELQVASQCDANWTEFSLLKGLGLVPEGYTKFYMDDETHD